MGVWLLTLPVAQAACEDPGTLVDSAENAVLEARFDDARALLGGAEAAWACGPVAEPRDLARLWIVEGVLKELGGADDDAVDLFTAAARLDVAAWNDDFGPEMRQRFEEVIGREPQGGEIVLRPDLERSIGVLDGRVVPFPAKTEGGFHLVQVGPTDGPMQWARMVFLPPGDRLVLTHDVVGSTTPEAIAATPPVYVADRPRSSTLLVAGGALTVLGLTSAALAVGQNGAMRRAEDRQALGAAYGRQRAFGYAGYGLISAGAVFFGFHVVR